jgi:hypothetical protein
MLLENDEIRNQKSEGMTNHERLIVSTKRLPVRSFGIRASFGFLVSDFVIQPFLIPLSFQPPTHIHHHPHEHFP